MAVTLIAAVSTWRDSRREAALQIDQLQATAKVIAGLSGEAASAKDVQGAYRALRSIAAMPNVLYARVETADGRLLSETGAGARLRTATSASDGRSAPMLALLRSRSVEISEPIVYARRPVGRVVVLGRMEGAGGRFLSSLGIGALAALAAAAAGLAIAWRLQRKITAPILALTVAMDEVRTSHAFDRKAAVEADDEVGALVDGFNAMLDEVRTRDEAIAKHMAGLERTVARRTADLVLAKDAADAANSAKSAFLATMSHEIRTPMNGVMAMAEMLAAGDLPPRQRRFAEVIANSGSSLLAIINDILDFSKIEAGKMELEAAPVDPEDVVDDVASLFWERARAKGLELVVQVHPDTPRRIQADAVRLRQVVGNLVNNAIKFTETGGVRIELSAPSPGKLKVAVRDSGIGIPRDKIAGLFDAFSQADQSTTRRFGGTGLGLAICKRLVDAMSGELTVQSAAGRGSLFAFEVLAPVLEPAEPWIAIPGGKTAAVAVGTALSRHALSVYLETAGLKLVEGQADFTVGEPGLLGARQGDGAVICLGDFGDDAPARLVRDDLADAVLPQPIRRRDLAALITAWREGRPLALAESVHAAGGALPSFAGRRILVVDDSAVNREVAMEALSRLGVDVSLAPDGLAGVEATLAETFDLVLMDGSMPELDGYEATREIRGREAHAGRTRTPIVALTAHVVGDAAEAWRGAGMDGVLHKPFTLKALAETLGRFMEASADRPKAEARPTAASVVVVSDLLDPRTTAELAAMAASGKVDFVERVRRLYRNNAPGAAKQLIEAAAAGDADAGARAAHALKSMSLNIGARAVADMAGRIEADARERRELPPAVAEAVYRKLLDTLEVLDGEKSSDPDEALMADLAAAIERDELSVVYQPQVDRDGNTLKGVESLIRWTHPTRGPISPAIFIPLAEHHGLIRPITRWVMDRAMAETADLDISVGLNASATEFSDPGFVDEVATLLARRGFDPARLEIEITETAVLGDGEEVRASIARLHKLGVKIALDDFGVGYSSLSHLRLFPFDKLKIDKTFVDACAKDVQSATLVHAVVSVGRALGMKVVAEGIETEDQQKFLRLAGVHLMQGYRFGKPEPIEALRARIAGNQHSPEATEGPRLAG